MRPSRRIDASTHNSYWQRDGKATDRLEMFGITVRQVFITSPTSGWSRGANRIEKPQAEAQGPGSQLQGRGLALCLTFSKRLVPISFTYRLIYQPSSFFFFCYFCCFCLSRVSLGEAPLCAGLRRAACHILPHY